MVIIKTAAHLQSFLQDQRRSSAPIGFVPTMGALHQGHISLIINAKESSKLVVSSIFVNPTQFNDPADFEKYPQTLTQDIDLLTQTGCDVLFLPSVAEMYPEGIQGGLQYELGFIETVYDGHFRPGHFQGVCRVVEKLLRLVEPDLLYLGQKDYQQCMVIRKMCELRQIPVTIRICATQREVDGLAMSSRNLRLNTEERRLAPQLYRIMQETASKLKSGSLQPLTENAREELSRIGFKPDYFEFADAGTLTPVTHWNGSDPLVLLAAAFLGAIRLIDNLIPEISDPASGLL